MNTLNVGDPVTYTIYTDSECGWVDEVSRNGKTVVVEFAKQTLLNGVNSKEPDALHFSPGGFVGHTSGQQRWKIERAASPRKLKFTLRKSGQWKIVGHGTKSPGCVLNKGHYPHYDFNF